ncbi:PPE domain-containing protein [Saccharopolyspora sp. NPDC002376]
MGAFDWLFGGREVAPPGQVEFVHAKIYGEVKGGPGVDSLSGAGKSWIDVGTAFNDAAAALARVLKDSEILMQGSAADQAREAVLPLAKATAEAADIAAATGAALRQQTDMSSDFYFSFVAPYEVPPDNIGWSDYVNPVAFAVKSGVRIVHEDVRDQVEAHARQQYEAYTQSTNERVNGLQAFAPPPTFTADVAAAETTPVRKVDPINGYEDVSDTRTGTEASQLPGPRTPADPVPAPDPVAPDEQPPEDTVSETPTESNSAWAPPVGGGNPVAGGGVPVQGPIGTGGGVVGGVVVPPGGPGGRSGSALPRPGSGIGRGGGPGAGRGVSGKPGGGGRSGTGSGTPAPGAVGSSGPGVRGASGGLAAGGPASGGRGKREEDKEHGRKFVKGGKDAWDDLEIPKVAPPVFGDWEAEALRGKPPRPSEEK